MQQQPVGVSFDLPSSASATRLSVVILFSPWCGRFEDEVIVLSAVGCPRAANLIAGAEASAVDGSRVASEMTTTPVAALWVLGPGGTAAAIRGE